jgi:hypothetical protein
LPNSRRVSKRSEPAFPPLTATIRRRFGARFLPPPENSVRHRSAHHQGARPAFCRKA